MIYKCKLKSADRPFIFFHENESRYFDLVAVNMESLIEPKNYLGMRKAALHDAESLTIGHLYYSSLMQSPLLA